MQIDHSTVRLQEGYKHIGIGGSTTAFGGNIIIDPITADGNHATNLMADLVGELEHYPPPFGLGMDEPDAEIHFHEVFLPKMGWQNSYLTNQHHYGQNYPYNPTPTKGH